MKTIFKIALVAAGTFSFAQVHAQTTHKDSTLGHKMSKTAKKVGDKTAEIGAKGASDVVDKKYADKVGPEGQTIYINSHSHYYYINHKGHRVYVKKYQLRDKPVS
jgi:hypothetical protein